MDSSAIASAAVGAQAGTAQSDIAMKVLKQVGDHEKEIAQMLNQSAQDSANRLANVQAGVGRALDISV